MRSIVFSKEDINYLFKDELFKEKDSHFYRYEGPNICINSQFIIAVTGNPIKMPCLRTNEKSFKEIFDMNTNALSEDGNSLGTYAKEIEVFQVIF